jgi:PIN domain nuclease of toxin-antitoxin system
VTDAVLDASALIAFLLNEKGADKVAAVLTRSCISAVNLAETFSKLVEYGKSLDAVAFQVDRLQIPVIPFDGEEAIILASLWEVSRAAGLSLGDRACLALGLKRQIPVLTADQRWKAVNVGVKVQVIR